MTGFEPAASSSRTKRATGLRYIPKWTTKNIGTDKSPDSYQGFVGWTGFEPATPCTPYKCATGLRHHPKGLQIYEISHCIFDDYLKLVIVTIGQIIPKNNNNKGNEGYLMKNFILNIRLLKAICLQTPHVTKLFG